MHEVTNVKKTANPQLGSAAHNYELKSSRSADDNPVNGPRTRDKTPSTIIIEEVEATQTTFQSTDSQDAAHECNQPHHATKKVKRI